MPRLTCVYCKTAFLKAYGALGNGATSHMSFNMHQFCDSNLLSYIAVGDLDDYIAQTRCMRTSGDRQIELKASWKTPQTMILSPVIRQIVSPVLLTLRKMSLKPSQMSLNRRYWHRCIKSPKPTGLVTVPFVGPCSHTSVYGTQVVSLFWKTTLSHEDKHKNIG